MNKPMHIAGTEHWTHKEGGVKLFLWNKNAGDPEGLRADIVRARIVNGLTADFRSARAGRPNSSAMEFFATRGYDTWCVDMEGYGRSTKDRDNNAPIAYGADDCFAAASYIENLRGKRPLLVYGISSGALRAALFAQRYPGMVARLALDAMVWTGEGSPTLAERSKRLPEFRARNRRPIDREFVRSIFDAIIPAPPMTSDRGLCRRHPGVRRFGADRNLCRHVREPAGVDPEKITVPTLIMRGEYDGIASSRDLLKFFERLPNPDKQFAVMPGIAHASFHQKNYPNCYHILASFFSQPEPVYRGGQ